MGLFLNLENYCLVYKSVFVVSCGVGICEKVNWQLKRFFNWSNKRGSGVKKERELK